MKITAVLAALFGILATIRYKRVTCESTFNTCQRYVIKLENSQRVTCQTCPPGTYFIEDCNAENGKANCSDCPSGYFAPAYNLATKCARCKTECKSPREELNSTCTSTHDNICQCKKSRYKNEEGICLNYNTCQPGEGVVKQGDHNTNVECAPCGQGKFSTITSSTEECQLCKTECINPHEELNRTCSPTHDNICQCKQSHYKNTDGICVYHKKCPPGEGVVTQGDHSTDVECAPCGQGKFSANTSPNEKCQLCRHCSVGSVVKECQPDADTVCEADRDQLTTTSVHVNTETVWSHVNKGLLIGVVCSVILNIILIIVGIMINKRKSTSERKKKERTILQMKPEEQESMIDNSKRSGSTDNGQGFCARLFRIFTQSRDDGKILKDLTDPDTFIDIMLKQMKKRKLFFAQSPVDTPAASTGQSQAPAIGKYIDTLLTQMQSRNLVVATEPYPELAQAEQEGTMPRNASAASPSERPLGNSASNGKDGTDSKKYLPPRVSVEADDATDMCQSRESTNKSAEEMERNFFNVSSVKKSHSP